MSQVGSKPAGAMRRRGAYPPQTRMESHIATFQKSSVQGRRVRSLFWRVILHRFGARGSEFGALNLEVRV